VGADHLKPPVTLLRPVAVKRLPESMPGGPIFQAKLDGHRVAAFVTSDGVILQARSTRIVSSQFPEVLASLAELPAGCVLDGEVVAISDGRFDFAALAASPAQRRRRKVAVSYVPFDLLADRGEDITGLPLSERWPRLLALLDGAPAQLQPVLSTTDRAEAEAWMMALAPIGVEGIVAKPLASRYEAAHGWVKVRTADTVDGVIVGTAGHRDRPQLRVRLDDGHTVTTEPLTPTQAREVANALEAAHGAAVRVELRVSTGRHGSARFVRVRLPE
jgi:ATP-dependent DNA ligase